MPERLTLTALDGIAARFGALPAGSVPRFNLAPLQQALIRTVDGVALARWGLLPPWRGHGGKRAPHVVRAQRAQLDEVPLLRNAFKRQRCLVIADGFFVWQREPKGPPLWLRALDGDRPRLVALAGVAATHRDDHQPSFALIVAPAQVAHDGVALAIEAPIVVAPEADAAWLGGPLSAAQALLALSTVWRAEPVSTYVTAVEHDDPGCVAPLRNPRQGQLF